MHEARPVNSLQSRKKLRGNFACLVQRHRSQTSKALRQREAVDVFHRHELLLVRGNQVEDPADVRRYDFTRRSHFASQKLARAFAGSAVGADGLEGHMDAQLEIEAP